MIQVMHILLAAAAVQKPASPELTRSGRLTLVGALPVLIVALVLVLATIVWALFVRTNRRPARERGRLVDGEDRATLGGSRRRRRRRREKNRPRFPTLSEAGGLPPPRSSDAPPPVP